MYVRRVVGLLFILIVAGPATADAEPATGDDTELVAEAGPAAEIHSTNSADIDLGTAVLNHGQVAAGPFHVAAGLYDRVTVGTYTLPWVAAAVTSSLTDDSTISIAPNASVRMRLFGGDANIDNGISRSDRLQFSGAVDARLFYARFGDIDGDGLQLRALIAPIRLLMGLDWSRRHDTTVEFGGVYSSLTGEHVEEGDTWIHGLAIAHSFHAGVTHRLRLARSLSVWARVRTLLGHAPVRASFETRLSDDVDLDIQARANAAELSTGFTGTAGIHLGATRYGLTAGVGYGTWFVPGLYLPVSQNLPFAEFNVYFRFR